MAKLVDSNLDVVAEAPTYVEKQPQEQVQEAEEEPVKAKVEEYSSTSDGWMEMVWPSSSTSDEELSTGDNVTWVIRLRQAENHDTMLSSCIAYDEDASDNNDVYNRGRDLTDYRGCSVNRNTMPDFQVSFNSLTGIKALKTRLTLTPSNNPKAFSSNSNSKRNAKSRLNVKCNVLVCRSNCPVAKCDDDEDDSFAKVAIIDKFLLKTRVAYNVKPKKQKRPEALRMEEQREVEEALLEQQLLQQEASSQDNLLCMSPSRVILAFGIVLFILLLALVIACMLWMRARSRRHPPSPPPPLRGPKGPMGGTIPSMRGRPPVLMPARGGMPPYIRVMQ